jgi:hypothetical protein
LAGRPSVGETTVVRFDKPDLRFPKAVEHGKPDLRFWHDLKRLNVVRFGEPDLRGVKHCVVVKK